MSKKLNKICVICGDKASGNQYNHRFYSYLFLFLISIKALTSMPLLASRVKRSSEGMPIKERFVDNDL